MGEKFDARRTAKLRRLTSVAEMFHACRTAGSNTPAEDIAKALDTNRSTVRSWIARARAEGLITETRHVPRRVDWGAKSWTACAECRVQWPCTPADAGNWSE